MNAITTVLTSATGVMLASLADVKDAIGITDNQYDETLTRFITRASRRIETHVGRSLAVQRYQTVLPAYGRKRLMLSAYPVRAILRMFDGTDTGEATAYTATDYHLNTEVGSIERDEGWSWTLQTKPDVIPFPEPGQEYGQYLVEFSAGYILPAGKDSGSTWDGTTSTGPTIPSDIEDACIQLVKSQWHSRKREDGLVSKTVGDLSLTWESQKGELPDSVMAMLAPYRSVL